jgi:predicted nucleic acid-binding protein
VIFVDSNVPMYLVGAAHPHKVDAQIALERAISDRERLVTDAEVLQEILHRYVAIGRREAIRPCLEALLGVADEVFPVTRDLVCRAADLVLAAPGLTARDAVHVAAMEANGVSQILSFDRHFDGVPGIDRIS